MDATTFKRQRDSLDLSIAEAADLLGVSRASITGWQAGWHRIPGWVDDKLRELRGMKSASHAERDVRRTVEDRYSHLSNRLYFGEIPDGWLPLVESFLQDVDEHLPDGSKNGECWSMDIKEKWGSIRISCFLDLEDPDASESFWKWIDPRIDKLEHDAERTCARCGSHDDVSMTKSGWILPLCRRHRLLRAGEL